MSRFQKLTVLAAALAVMALTGCAGHPVPREDLARAQAEVENARQAGATSDSPVELRRAQEKLDAAHAAVKDENYEEAERLAEEAQADAELAQQKTLSAQTQRSVAELRQSIDLLRQELRLPAES